MVEVLITEDAVLVRNSNDKQRTLAFAHDEWAKHLRAVELGEHDLD